jgi:uncharacterized protein DUF3800
LALFSAYLDESGTHRESPLTVVAGYVGSVRHWEAFEAEWPALLTRHGLDFLHGKDMSGWREDRRHALVADVINLLEKSAIYGTAAAVYNKDHQRVFPQGVKVPMVDTKYGACFRMCMIKMCNPIREAWPGQRVSFVLEDGAKSKNNAVKIFDLSKVDGSWSKMMFPLGNLAFAGKRDYGALQAADLLAHAVHQSMRAEPSLARGTPTFNQLALSSSPFQIWHISAEMMEVQKSDVRRVYAEGRREKALRKRLLRNAT